MSGLRWQILSQIRLHAFAAIIYVRQISQFVVHGSCTIYDRQICMYPFFDSLIDPEFRRWTAPLEQAHVGELCVYRRIDSITASFGQFNLFEVAFGNLPLCCAMLCFPCLAMRPRECIACRVFPFLFLVKYNDAVSLSPTLSKLAQCPVVLEMCL